LSRGRDGRPCAPVRIAHLGLGNFFRAHQAWYTEHAPDADRWGIAAFGGRTAHAADALTAQDCLYTLRVVGEPAQHQVISSISHAHAAADHRAWLAYLRSPDLAVVTLTVTEHAYAPDGKATGDDVERLRAGTPPRTVPGRMVAGLSARRAAHGRPLAVVPCDNLAANGARTRQAVTAVADAVDPALTRWIDANVTWVTTVVDRITPATTPDDVDTVTAATGRHDAVPVVTEAFSEWVLAGEFPAGRPHWDEVGARVVDDPTPFANRKLWLLNGAHSLIAYAGGGRGHDTVADAFDDPVVRGWVEQWWDEAAPHVAMPPSDLDRYRTALRNRFSSRHLEHRLAQIAADGSQKLPVRIVPVALAERRAGRMPWGAVRVVAGWVAHLRGSGVPVRDPAVDLVAGIRHGTVGDGVRVAVGHLDPDLAADTGFVDAVRRAVE
jgi:fructuronate reductase